MLSWLERPSAEHNAGMRVRELRLQRGWSQEQLAERCGLSVRTIQRIERGGEPGLASAEALARVLEVEPAALRDIEQAPSQQDDFRASVTTCLRNYAGFDGTAGRAEYWWFMLFVLLVSALASLAGEAFGAAAMLVLLLPLLAAGSRRLHDTGRSGWWQLFALAPFGAVVPLILLAQPTAEAAVLSSAVVRE